MKKILGLLALLLLFTGSAQAQGMSKLISASPTCDTSAYATGELVGGKLTFTNALRPQTGAGYLVGIRMVDQAAQAVDFDVVLFSEDPTSTTFTDQAAFDIADGDLSKVIGVVNLGSSSRFAFADNSVHYLGSLSMPLFGRTSAGAVSGTIYGALISRGTPTFAASTDVVITLEILQD